MAELGFDHTCESVYRALLARPQLGLDELREDLGLSDADLRRALDKLSELALVRTSFDASSLVQDRRSGDGRPGAHRPSAGTFGL
ncbi:hypothetical protein ACWD11_32685 [Streptomyces sp. NPDC002776]